MQSLNSNPSINRRPLSRIFSVTWLAGDVKEPTHSSKRVGHVVPSIVVYLSGLSG